MNSIFECKDKIKEILSNDKDMVVKVLEALGCHSFLRDFAKDEIRCALPECENNTSVSILMNEYVNVQVFSRGEYESKYKGKLDIISFTRFILGCGFDDAIKFLCGVIGIDFNGDRVEYHEMKILKVIEKEKRNSYKGTRIIQHEILDVSFLNRFTDTYVQEWVDEGIPIEIQKKYHVMIDEKDMRYVIPIFDKYNNLITAKGRTYMPNFKLLGIPKYWYYKAIGKGNNDILYGLNLNEENIKLKNEIILFEGEKSVMKADSYGYDWAVSVGKDGINPNLVSEILKLHCNVVIAFDKDVPYKDVLIEAKKLSMFTNVYIIFDDDDLLDIEVKDAPVDKGKEVWEILYNNKRRVV